MDIPIAVVDTNQEEGINLCKEIARFGYRAIAFNSVAGLEEYLNKSPCRIVLIDVDSVHIGDHSFRELRSKITGLHILVISQRQYHPDLENSMRFHIQGCLRKPVDREELGFFLKTIIENHGEANSDYGI